MYFYMGTQILFLLWAVTLQKLQGILTQRNHFFSKRTTLFSLENMPFLFGDFLTLVWNKTFFGNVHMKDSLTSFGEPIFYVFLSNFHLQMFYIRCVFEVKPIKVSISVDLFPAQETILKDL